MLPQLKINRRTGTPARRQQAVRVAGAGPEGSPGPAIAGASQSFQPRPPAWQYGRLENVRDAWESNVGDWLTTAEQHELNRLRHPHRRQTWLAGRWLARQLIRESCALSPDDPASIEILSRNAAGKSVRPQVIIDNRLADLCLSISHSSRGVLAALTTQPAATIGVDLTIPEPLKPGFLRTWFTPAERKQLNETDPRQIATHWAIKEAVYKACNAGESFAPRNIEVFGSAEGRLRCYYRGSDVRHRSDIQVREIDGHVAVAASFGWPGLDRREAPAGGWG